MKQFILFCSMCLSCTTIFAQDSEYVFSQLQDANQGQFQLELKLAHCSDLQTADMLWIYGDGNFDILHSCNLSSTHNYRCNPVHDPTLFPITIYSPTKPPQLSSKQIRGYKQGQLVDSFVPTGQQVEHTGWVKQGHYGAVRIFPAQLQPQTSPVVIIALENEQAQTLSGRIYLYYKNNLIRNGEAGSLVQHRSIQQFYNYGNVNQLDLQQVPARSGYTALAAWSYQNLLQHEERHIFAALDSNSVWNNLSDINTAEYKTEFLVVVNGACDNFSFENEIPAAPQLIGSIDPAILETSYTRLENGTGLVDLDLLFYNEGFAPVGSIQVEFQLPQAWIGQPVVVLENAIGPVNLHPDKIDSGSNKVTFRADAVGLGKYDPQDKNTFGRIRLQVILPENLGQTFLPEDIQATVKFDDHPTESAQLRIKE